VLTSIDEMTVNPLFSSNYKRYVWDTGIPGALAIS